MSKTKSAPRVRTWRDIPDSQHRSFPSRPNPESLIPSDRTVLAAVGGNEEARIITDAWSFRFPVHNVASLEVLA